MTTNNNVLFAGCLEHFQLLTLAAVELPFHPRYFVREIWGNEYKTYRVVMPLEFHVQNRTEKKSGGRELWAVHV